MDKKQGNLITRRQTLSALATLAAGALIKPSSIFCIEPAKKLRVAIIGDWGSGNDQQRNIGKQMLKAHQRSPFDFIVTAGDNIYPNGNSHYFNSNFEQPYAGLLRDNISFYAVLGNHDVADGRQDQCQYPLFNMNGQNYYSLKKGDGLVEFFMLDSTDFDLTQAAWLETALQISTAKWKIVVFHHPIYSSGKRHGSSLKLRKKLEPLLVRYRVNAAFSGHDHIYERTLPQQGIQYFVTGAAGKVRQGDIDLKSNLSAATFDQDNHFMVIEITDKQIEFQAIS
ncbi:MAG: metallophosphoesterase, partial [Acidobacteriota bacterium]